MSAPTRARRALVVDDHPPMRKILRYLLELDGWSVAEARDGRNALNQARQHPPDVVITDLDMPRMDGVALARALRDGENGTDAAALVAVTRNVREGEESGLFDAVLPKPLKPRRLREVLDTL